MRDPKHYALYSTATPAIECDCVERTTGSTQVKVAKGTHFFLSIFRVNDSRTHAHTSAMQYSSKASLHTGQFTAASHTSHIQFVLEVLPLTLYRGGDEASSSFELSFSGGHCLSFPVKMSVIHQRSATPKTADVGRPCTSTIKVVRSRKTLADHGTTKVCAPSIAKTRTA